MALEESMSVLRALTDPTRVRLLAVLDGEELTVAELQRILDVPQSRVSTHLAKLKEAGLAFDRTDGAYRYYRLVDESAEAPWRATWAALREPLSHDAQLERDRQRRDAILLERN